jgi:hypothetical protein
LSRSPRKWPRAPQRQPETLRANFGKWSPKRERNDQINPFDETMREIRRRLDSTRLSERPDYAWINEFLLKVSKEAKEVVDTH